MSHQDKMDNRRESTADLDVRLSHAKNVLSVVRKQEQTRLDIRKRELGVRVTKAGAAVRREELRIAAEHACAGFAETRQLLVEGNIKAGLKRKRDTIDAYCKRSGSPDRDGP
eukprot:TRINITY_DN5295_c2_g2_i2.p3 TRINITY_DN5295_c2_g2~~TRINITY_DN5295_c2_g2_i2.p3  ORF type:complete len:112 (+),score=16.61 TRINITY_DN5295_c2_g2_i2:159-494(+)